MKSLKATALSLLLLFGAATTANAAPTCALTAGCDNSVDNGCVLPSTYDGNDPLPAGQTGNHTWTCSIGTVHSPQCNHTDRTCQNGACNTGISCNNAGTCTSLITSSGCTSTAGLSGLSGPDGAGTYTWTCPATNSGGCSPAPTPDTCSYTIPSAPPTCQNGACNTSVLGGCTSSASGTPVVVDSSGNSTWTCPATNSGGCNPVPTDSPLCSVPTAGVCAHDEVNPDKTSTTLGQIDNSNSALCSTGTVSDATPDDSHSGLTGSWKCTVPSASGPGTPTQCHFCGSVCSGSNCALSSTAPLGFPSGTASPPIAMGASFQIETGLYTGCYTGTTFNVNNSLYTCSPSNQVNTTPDAGSSTYPCDMAPSPANSPSGSFTANITYNGSDPSRHHIVGFLCNTNTAQCTGQTAQCPGTNTYSVFTCD